MEAKSKLNVSEYREVVLSLLRREEPAGVLARRYGVSENALYRWRDEFMTAGEVALANGRGKAERLCGPLEKMPLLVTDNGPTFIARKFHEYIKNLYSQVRIRYRTPTQLGLLERFHQTLKVEEVYRRLYDSPFHGRQCLAEFRVCYNTIRPHWALVPEEGGDPKTPHDVYVEGKTIGIPKWQGWAKTAKAKLDKLLTEDAA